MTTAGTSTGRAGRWSSRERLLLAAVLVVAVVLGSRGLLSEGAVSLQGDMPRYMMNGVLMRDFAASGGAWTVDGVIDFVERYYIRYPALSLGHHPPLASAVAAPFYAVFGVSVFSARLAVLACLLVGAGALFALARRAYDGWVAFGASLLFVTNPLVVGFGQVVLSEVPTLALVILATLQLLRFTDSRRTRDYAWFVVAAAASLYAKQLAGLMFPVYAVLLVWQGGWRLAVRRDVLLLTVLGAVLSAPMVALTLALSPHNVGLVLGEVGQGGASPAFGSRPTGVVSTIVSQVGVVGLVGFLVGLAVAAVRRDARVLIGLLWVAVAVLGARWVTGSIDPVRYAIVAVPGYFLVTASVLSAGRRLPIAAGLLVLAVLTGAQVWAARDVQPVGAEGYEEAAEYVLAQPDTPTVLVSTPVDTGYFVFFVRKHDPGQRLVVLRADKLFTTSRMKRMSLNDRIRSLDEIYPLLDTYGVRMIVVEDRPTPSRVLNGFRDELRTDRFAERRRIPLRSYDARLRGVSLVVYEYLGAPPPNLDAEVDVQIPLISREIKVTLGDLIRKR